MVELGAFDELYATYRSLVFGVALRVLRSSIEAEDVVQIIFLKAWMHPESFRGGNIESWLTTLAKNCSIDVLRKRRHELAALPMESLRLSASSNDTEQDALATLRASAVREALRSLRVDQRDVVVACFLDGQSHEHIARATALPLGTVKTRIRSGLRHLRRQATNL
ncbi:MAG TPA: sigma-70 family RNA polymerase sigma factor [Candidatus Baltobacteraceae bacterium]|jgi:RNA polymerase sigma-70 factor (ECF subfamily)